MHTANQFGAIRDPDFVASMELAKRPEAQGKDVAVSGVRKTYKSTVALAEISLAVARGEFCTLLGASGSGKTTLLKIIAGFESPDSGNVRIAGCDVTQMPIADRNIGMVFQNYSLFPHMSVFENVAFPLRMRRLNHDDIRRRVAAALDLVSLGELRQRLPRELSGGQQQRVALARALIFNPDLLLMDEPLGALDKNLRQAIQLQLKKLHHDLGLTVIFVTHDQDEAMNLSDRIVIMDQGRIVQSGAPQELYLQPDTPFVAGFLGECNFIEKPGCIVGVRPENIRIGTQLDDSDLRQEGQIIAATFCGMHWKLFLKCQNATMVAYAPVAGASNASFEPGRTVTWGFSAADAMAFSVQ